MNPPVPRCVCGRTFFDGDDLFAHLNRTKGQPLANARAVAAKAERGGLTVKQDEVFNDSLEWNLEQKWVFVDYPGKRPFWLDRPEYPEDTSNLICETCQDQIVVSSVRGEECDLWIRKRLWPKTITSGSVSTVSSFDAKLYRHVGCHVEE